MKSLNLGVIGLGAIGQKHCSAVAKLERASICAVADVNEKVLNSTAAQYRATPYTDVKQMLSHPGLDAVIVATPDQLHREACVWAAQCGKHILVEKPIAFCLENMLPIAYCKDNIHWPVERITWPPKTLLLMPKRQPSYPDV